MYCILLDWRFLVMLWNLCLPSFFRLRCSAASRQRHLLFPHCPKTTSHWCLFWPSWLVTQCYLKLGGSLLGKRGKACCMVSLTACHDVTISYCSHISSAHITGSSVEWYRELVLSPISDTQYLYQSFTNCKGFASAINVIDQACTHACFAHWLVTAIRWRAWQF